MIALLVASLAGLQADSPAKDLKAPAEFRVKVDTSKGEIVLKIVRDWAPRGADRFFTLVKDGYFDEARFYRVLRKYVAQFGYNGDPKVSAKWRSRPIEDDPVKETNTRGRITFAKGGPNSRTSQLFINLRDTKSLDRKGFAPIGEVVEGMKILDDLYARYGGSPSQKAIFQLGNAYLEKKYPKLDFIKTARVEE